MSWLWRTLWIAAVYFILARPALGLADPPGYASPIWPAAGFAVGVVYCYRYGYRAVGGVALGSALTNWTLAPGADVLVPCLIGAGAALQAAAARYLLVVRLGERAALERFWEIIQFLAISGPVASLVNGLWGPGVLRLSGILSPETWLQHSATWWVGDSIGAVIFAPAVLALLSRNDPAWEGRWGTICVVALIALVSTLGLFIAGKMDSGLSYQVAVSCFLFLGAVQHAAIQLTAGWD
jgi:integral membrane sensor domain MASE1